MHINPLFISKITDDFLELYIVGEEIPLLRFKRSINKEKNEMLSAIEIVSRKLGIDEVVLKSVDNWNFSKLLLQASSKTLNRNEKIALSNEINKHKIIFVEDVSTIYDKKIENAILIVPYNIDLTEHKECNKANKIIFMKYKKDGIRIIGPLINGTSPVCLRCLLENTNSEISLKKGVELEFLSFQALSREIYNLFCDKVNSILENGQVVYKLGRNIYLSDRIAYYTLDCKK